MEIKKQYLPEDEYFPTKTHKKTIILHHTEGSHRPDWVINAWDKDKSKGGKPLKVATQFVIGGVSTRDGNDEWDGVILEAFPDGTWAHHLGTKNTNNTQLNKQSIGIELCNYGPLIKSSNGQYYTYVNSRVPESMVIDLGKNWRGYRYYHSYTDKQLESVKYLIEEYSKIHSIDIKKGLVYLFEKKKSLEDMEPVEIQTFLNSQGFLGMNGKSLLVDGIIGNNTKYAMRIYENIKRGDIGAFDFNMLANEGGEGIWSHSNFRKDKSDVYPHPKLIQMLKNLKPSPLD